MSLDFMTTFSDAPLDHKLRVKHPKVFEKTGEEDDVHVLSRALYGARQMNLQ